MEGLVLMRSLGWDFWDELEFASCLVNMCQSRYDMILPGKGKDRAHL